MTKKSIADKNDYLKKYYKKSNGNILFVFEITKATIEKKSFTFQKYDDIKNDDSKIYVLVTSIVCYKEKKA